LTILAWPHPVAVRKSNDPKAGIPHQLVSLLVVVLKFIPDASCFHLCFQLFGSSLVHLLVYVIGHIQITKLRATKKLQQLETM
jgi:hypothetical protein